MKPKTIEEFSEMKARNNDSTGTEGEKSSDNMSLLSPERTPAKSSGRRVSFGSINWIPQSLPKVLSP